MIDFIIIYALIAAGFWFFYRKHPDRKEAITFTIFWPLWVYYWIRSIIDEVRGK